MKNARAKRAEILFFIVKYANLLPSDKAFQSLDIFCPVGIAKKSEVPICSARTSLTYPSSFCQAGTRTTVRYPWLCKLQRNKHELPVHTPSPNTHGFLVLQISPLHTEGRQFIFFLIVPPEYYWPLLHICRFLYSSQARQFLFKNTWSSCEDFKIPQVSHCRGSGDFYWLNSFLSALANRYPPGYRQRMWRNSRSFNPIATKFGQWFDIIITCAQAVGRGRKS